MTTLPRLVGLRYLTARKGSRFMSLFSLASIAGIALSVLAMILVLSVMNGFEGEMRDRLLRTLPHGQVQLPASESNWQALAEQLATEKSVVAVAPQNRARVLLAANDSVQGGDMYGVLPELESNVSGVASTMIQGEWSALADGRFGVVLGRSLARQLQLNVGDHVTIILPKVSVTPLGVFPRTRRFEVVGIFASSSQMDGAQLYVHMHDAGRLLRQGERVSSLRIKFDDVLAAPDLLAGLQARYPKDWQWRSWRDENQSLFNAMQLEKTMVSLMLGVIVVVAVFNLVSILTMAVADRRKDVAVLRTMGASKRDVLQIFLIYGLAMGLLGISLGAIGGSALALLMEPINHAINQLSRSLDAPMVFAVRMPAVWQFQQVLGIVAVAMALCLLAVLYPAWRASLIHPAEALRYE